MKAYDYVGPEEIKARVADEPPGTTISNREELESWLSSNGLADASEVTCTFVIDKTGLLRIADRHSEHIACSGGESVLSAGEITFARHQSEWVIESISNQSTGFCPEPESWEAVTAALDGTGLESPKGWSNEILFRRCPRCGERNIVKDSWFLCDMCDAELPKTWNFTTEEQ